MNKIASVQIFFWEEPRDYATGDLELALGDEVIVKIDMGTEIGRVVKLKDISSDNVALESIIRKATGEDLDKVQRAETKKVEILKQCRQLIRQHDLPMKLVGVFNSFDGSRLTFTFTAESRVDFRKLVRDLTRTFQKSIRLQQIGSRDEAKMVGALGMCGQEVCCARWLTGFASITTDMARVQQMSHRGSERISGICGRLMCCLNYEADQYREWLKKMPALGSQVKTPQGKGIVFDRNLPKQMVKVRLDDKEQTQIEVPLDKIR